MRATCRLGARRSASGRVRAPARRTSSLVMANTEDAARPTASGRFDTDVIWISASSSMEKPVRSCRLTASAATACVTAKLKAAVRSTAAPRCLSTLKSARAGRLEWLLIRPPSDRSPPAARAITHRRRAKQALRWPKVPHPAALRPAGSSWWGGYFFAGRGPSDSAISRSRWVRICAASAGVLARAMARLKASRASSARFSWSRKAPRAPWKWK
jgi:hypothetical protein